MRRFCFCFSRSRSPRDHLRHPPTRLHNRRTDDGVRTPRLVPCGVDVRPVGRRLRRTYLGGAIRPGAAGASRTAVLPADPRTHAVPGAQGWRQGEVQGHVLGDERGQLRVPGTGALPVRPDLPVLIRCRRNYSPCPPSVFK